MTQNTSVSPLSHEFGRNTPARAFDRVEDEYVFTVVADDAPDADEQRPLTHSIHVDPADGRDGELVLDVRTRHAQRRAAAPDGSFTVTVPVPELDDPPRIETLESTLEAWFDQDDGREASNGVAVADTGQQRAASERQNRPSRSTPHAQ